MPLFPLGRGREPSRSSDPTKSRETYQPAHRGRDPRDDSSRIARRVFLLGGAGVVVVGGAAVAARAALSGGPDSAATGSPSASRSASPTAGSSPTPTPTPTPSKTVNPSETAEPKETATAKPAVPVTGAMPTGEVTSNGTRWKQVFAEDFLTPAHTGRVLSTYPRMGAYESGKDTSGYGEYAPDLVLSVHDSVLDYHVGTLDGQALVASVLPDNYAPHQYARVSVRYRASSIRGYKFVGLLWPESNQWSDGEIDWPEGDLDGRARPASQVVGAYDSSGNHIFAPPVQYFAATDQTAWHIATTEWTRGVVRFYWDGVLLATVTQGVPTKPMRVTLQAETWLDQGAPPAGDGHIEVDWVVIYEPA